MVVAKKFSLLLSGFLCLREILRESHVIFKVLFVLNPRRITSTEAYYVNSSHDMHFFMKSQEIYMNLVILNYILESKFHCNFKNPSLFKVFLVSKSIQPL